MRKMRPPAQSDLNQEEDGKSEAESLIEVVEKDRQRESIRGTREGTDLVPRSAPCTRFERRSVVREPYCPERQRSRDPALPANVGTWRCEFRSDFRTSNAERRLSPTERNATET